MQLTSAYYIITPLLLIIVFLDLKTLNIPHLLIWITLLSGIVYSIFTFGFVSGFVHALAGFLTGFSFFFILYLLGPMGAGDVKLAAALGTFLGANKALLAAVTSMIAGGLFASSYLIILLLSSNSSAAKRKIPFAPAIACGTLLSLCPSDFLNPVKTALGQ